MSSNIVLLSEGTRGQHAGSTSSRARPLPPGYIHLGIAKEIAPTLRDLGIDPDDLIREAGLNPNLFNDATNVISHAALGRLLGLCVARTRCPHFGLLVGKRATIQSLGLVGRLMQHSATVGDALKALVSHLSVQDRLAVPSLAIVGDMALLSYAVYQPEAQSADQISDGAIAAAVNALRDLCGAGWRPTEVFLPRAQPIDPEPFRRHFQAPVRFNHENAAIILPLRDLQARIDGADPMLRTMLEEKIRQMKGGAGTAFSDDIRRLLRIRLASRRCSADDVAGLLAINRRTLSRRLKGSGAGYRSITNETRFEIARQLLEQTEVPLGQIAAALGYSEASAFTRAFRRWSGVTPTAWRTADARG